MWQVNNSPASNLNLLLLIIIILQSASTVICYIHLYCYSKPLDVWLCLSIHQSVVIIYSYLHSNSCKYFVLTIFSHQKTCQTNAIYLNEKLWKTIILKVSNETWKYIYYRTLLRDWFLPTNRLINSLNCVVAIVCVVVWLVVGAGQWSAAALGLRLGFGRWLGQWQAQVSRATATATQHMRIQ